MQDIIERLDNEETCIDAIDDAIEEIKELRETLTMVKSILDYLQGVWGKEGVTDGVVDRINAALPKKEDTRKLPEGL